jgi:hypothetical protein
MQLFDFKELISKMPVPHQAFTSKRTTWARHIDGSGKANAALRAIFSTANEVRISRSDLRNMAKEVDISRFIMATIIWGYPRGMRGNHVTNLIQQFESLTQIIAEAKATSISNWQQHYRQLKPITGIGLSTYTKFLSFLPTQVHGHSALILDDRIIEVAKQNIFEELAELSHLRYENAAKFYPDYLRCIANLAIQLSVEPEQIEFFLFEFGLNLKPLNLIR